MELTELQQDIQSLLKHSKLGKYQLSRIDVSVESATDESVDLEKETKSEIIKKVKGKNKNYSAIFKLKK